jgi:hypothetical protein
MESERGATKMKDKEFLVWLRNRLIQKHGENPDFDYMHKLQGIIDAYPSNKESAWGNIEQKKKGVQRK